MTVTHSKARSTTSTASGQFTNNTIINNHDPVLTVLWPRVAADAIFDSAAQYAAGRCHPGTRTRMIGSITDWIKDFETTKRLLWLYGAAGAGKSALARTICELLQQSYPCVYGGSFFFASSSSDRGNANKLFSTLAYQLAIHFPPMRKEINDALAKDPSLPTKSIEVQLFSLIVQPLLRCQSLLSKSPVLIVDGLDECREAEEITQSKIVSIIGQAIVDHNPPLRFMFASHPEYWIRDVFGTARLASITLLLSLRDDVDADTDIKTYLAEGFKTIYLENNRTMRSVVPPWPSTKILDHLVYEASGQYVYASTVLKFVRKSSRYHNPQEQLRIITSPGPHRASAFSELDALYMKIISAYPEWATMKRVLAFHLSYHDLEIPILAVQTLLGINQNEFLLMLDALSALIDIQNHTPSRDDWYLKGTLVPNELFGNLYDGCEIISFCHRCFGEFLEDAKRSKSFYIDPSLDPIPAEMLNECLCMIYRNMEQNYQVAPYRYLNITLATYTCMQAVITICATMSDIGVRLELLRHMTAFLGRFDPSRVVHTRSLFDFLQDMEPLQSIAQSLPDDYPPETLDEMKTVCDEFRECVNLAYRRAFCALPFCSDFRATPALVYLLEYCHAEHDDPPPLTLPGVGDLRSTMQEYGHVLCLRYDYLKRVWFFAGRNMNQIFNGGDEPGWRATGTWRDCHSELAHHSLKYLLRKDNPDYITASVCVDLLREFFGRSVSDIYGIEYFQNSNNLAILSAITGPALFWSDRQGEKCRMGGQFDSEILPPIFYWINRTVNNLTCPS